MLQALTAIVTHLLSFKLPLLGHILVFKSNVLSKARFLALLVLPRKQDLKVMEKLMHLIWNNKTHGQVCVEISRPLQEWLLVWFVVCWAEQPRAQACRIL
jgi:hypothetical protein